MWCLHGSRAMGITEDAFALRLNGKSLRVTMKDFERLATRWNGAADETHALVQRLASAVHEQLNDVIARSLLEPTRAGQYRTIVSARLAGLDRRRRQTQE